MRVGLQLRAGVGENTATLIAGRCGHRMNKFFTSISNRLNVRRLLKLGEPIRIDVGCGKTPRPGYVGCDIRPLPGIAIVSPAWAIPLPSGSVDAIYSRHMIEHASLEDAARILRHFYSLLKVGGELDINTPDLERTIAQAHMPGDSPYVSHVTVSNADHALFSLFGWQTNPHDIHRWAYTEASLAALLRNCGFADVRRIDDTESGSGPLNLRMVARKEK